MLPTSEAGPIRHDYDRNVYPILREGLRLGVDYGLTLTYYDPSPEGLACGSCDACLLRLKGFMENGMKDPTGYQHAVPLT